MGRACAAVDRLTLGRTVMTCCAAIVPRAKYRTNAAAIAESKRMYSKRHSPRRDPDLRSIRRAARSEVKLVAA